MTLETDVPVEKLTANQLRGVCWFMRSAGRYTLVRWPLFRTRTVRVGDKCLASMHWQRLLLPLSNRLYEYTS
jgi:hypothetical protein